MVIKLMVDKAYIGYSDSVADPAIGVGGELPPPRPPAENVAPPGQKFQTIHESLPSGSCKHIFYKHA